MLKDSGNADSVCSHLRKIVDSHLRLQLSSNWREYLAQGVLPAKGESSMFACKFIQDLQYLRHLLNFNLRDGEIKCDRHLTMPNLYKDINIYRSV